MKTQEIYNVESLSQLAGTTGRTYGKGGGMVPGRCAGYTYDGACYCPDCASDFDVPTADGETFKMDHYPAYDDDGHPVTDGRGFGVGVLSKFDETDFPGDSCDVCHLRLQTTIIRYE